MPVNAPTTAQKLGMRARTGLTAERLAEGPAPADRPVLIARLAEVVKTPGGARGRHDARVRPGRVVVRGPRPDARRRDVPTFG
jgi:hypothetical protein